MNIFVTDPDPEISALWLDDKRQNKMIIESAQMLSTALRIVTNDDPAVCTGLYKITHRNHGCNIWTRTNQNNFMWLVFHALSMCHQYTDRSKKVHSCQSIIESCSTFASLLPDEDRTPFANHARSLEHGIDFSQVRDTDIAYRKYLVARWTTTDKRMPIWTGRPCPDWAQDEMNARYPDSFTNSREAIQP